MSPLVAAALIFGAVSPTFSQSLPAKDLRAGPPKTLDTLRSFPNIESKAAWKQRAQNIHEQVLVSCGLWPMPNKSPLHAKIFGRIEREGYSVEKVCFQTYAGFYLCGNLYRPLGHGAGPFPAILNPHGHWGHGRLEDTAQGSIAARCINFARQGMIAFSYDMVGYNDTIQLPNHRKVFLDPTNLLWNISLMGLQTWNSIRAVDFVSSLPDADKTRLACTGASGGGTQTFMLGSVEDRLAVQVPCVMVSHSMQGGCLCENAPGLRVDYSNMEIAAEPAPRPQLLVAATGDWTKATLTVEGPALAKIYRLFNEPDHLRYVRLNFNHNYNQSSREQVYGWFGKWLRGLPGVGPIPEQSYQKEPDADLRVFPDGKLPSDALNETQLVRSLVQQARQEWLDTVPKNPRMLARYEKLWMPAWKHTLQVDWDKKGLRVHAESGQLRSDYTVTQLALGRAGKGDRLPAILFWPRRDNLHSVVVLAHPDGKSAFLDAQMAPTGLAKECLERGLTVLLLDTFLTGDLADPAAAKLRDYFSNFFPTYNRTDCQERVQDLMTACAYARTVPDTRNVTVCGVGRAGLWALLAAPAADDVIADCAELDSASDQALLAQDLFVPGLRRLGTFEGVAILAANHPLLLHDTGQAFATKAVREVYQNLHAADRFRAQTDRVSDAAIAEWATRWAAAK